MRKLPKYLFVSAEKAQIKILGKFSTTEEHANDMSGYETNKFYTSKTKFFEKYLGILRYRTWNSEIIKSLSDKNIGHIFSIASGRAINEMSLVDSGFSVTCSDLSVPNSFARTKELFGDFEYIKFNCIEDNLNGRKFDCVICLSALYLFESEDLNRFFSKASALLNDNGLLLIDPGSAEHNTFTNILDLFLLIEPFAL
jgi:hypothetical protein